ncbi:MAG: TetR/AcrR family transcriptional regulator [Gemmatimonadota bacterium]
MHSPAPPPSPTPDARRDGAATRQRLIRAALELFSTIGFRETTTPTIAERAGVAEGTIYRHFKGKEQLLNEVYRGAQRWALSVVRDVEAEKSLRAPERLQRIARALIEMAERDPALLRMLLQPRGDRHLDAQSREAAVQFREALQQVVAMGKSDGQVRPGPAELWASVWLALVGFVVDRVGEKEWTPDHPQVTQTLEAAWDAISARPIPPSSL